MRRQIPFYLSFFTFVVFLLFFIQIVYGEQFTDELSEADLKISQAFILLKKAEKEGADITLLVKNLDEAVSLFLEASIFFERQDYENMNIKISRIIMICNDVIEESHILYNLAVENSRNRVLWEYFYNRVILIVLIILLFIIWRLFRKHYVHKILTYRPLVNDIES